MENKRQVGGGGGSSSTLDHLFGPKNSFPNSSSSASSSEIFGSIFSSPSAKQGRDPGMVGKQVASGRHGDQDNNTPKGSKGESSTGFNDKSSVYQNEAAEPCYFSSSIYYGGQENYSTRTTTSESQYTLKKDGGEQDPNGNNSALRGNWWQGSLYY